MTTTLVAGLEITEEFGHTVVSNPAMLRNRRQVGHINDPQQGRVHGPAEELDDMMAVMAAGGAVAAAGLEATNLILARPAAKPAEVVKPAKTEAAKPAKVVKTAKTMEAAKPVKVVKTAKTMEAAKPVKVAEAPKPGVIGALLAMLGDGDKRTRGDLYDALVAQFPDRASDTGGMRVTIGVQLGALVKKGHNIVSCASARGKLYYII